MRIIVMGLKIINLKENKLLTKIMNIDYNFKTLIRVISVSKPLN